jgi:hypothetical protein
MIYKLGRITIQFPMVLIGYQPRSSVLHKHDFAPYKFRHLKVFLKTDVKDTRRTIEKNG